MGARRCSRRPVGFPSPDPARFRLFLTICCPPASQLSTNRPEVKGPNPYPDVRWQADSGRSCSMNQEQAFDLSDAG